MHTGLSSVNATLFLCIATKSLANILYAISLVLDSHFKESFLLLTSFTSILFLNFPIVFPYTAYLIGFYNTFPPLSPFLLGFYFFAY